MILKQVNDYVTSYHWLQNEVTTINDLILVARQEIQDTEWNEYMNEKIIVLEDMLKRYDKMDGKRKLVLKLVKEALYAIEDEIREKIKHDKTYIYFEECLNKIKETKKEKRKEKEEYKKIK